MRHLLNCEDRAIVTRRRGFTLVELLVVIAIVLVLLAVTVTSFNYSTNADRVRAGARQLQSILIGARDKAIFANEIRGVRLLVDPNYGGVSGSQYGHTVSAVQYLGSPQKETGTLTFVNNSTVQLSFVSGSRLFYLYHRGSLRVGARIQIPSETGSWYIVTGISGAGQISLNRPNATLAASAASFPFVMELSPGVLGDAQPVALPRNVVIDLDGSKIPSNWYPLNYTNPYASQNSQMDILFNPRGEVIGDSISAGIVHLHIADSADVQNWNDPTTGVAGRNQSTYALGSLPIVPADNATGTLVVKRDRILLTLVARTGNVSVHHVNIINTSGASKADDPFLFAETGQVANK